MGDRAGQVLGGRYRLIERIGAGGMSEVYRAEHVELGRPVAVKLLLPAIAADQVSVERLRREATSTGNLGHPNIVQVADFDYTEDGAAYLVMEWLEGQTLAESLERGELSVEAGVELLAQACEGLAAAHAAGVVHRDVKPANLFVTRDRAGTERLVVVDFGIAKLGDDQHLTRTGTFVGTPDYMSPEQAEGSEVDGRTDVYAIGVILYELVAGVLPHQGHTVMEILQRKLTETPIPPGEVATTRPVPAPLSALILCCLAREPEERYQTMDELGAALRAVFREPDSEPAPAPPSNPRSRRRSSPPVWGILAVVALTAALLGGGVLAMRALDRDRPAPIEPARSSARIQLSAAGVPLVATVSPAPVLPQRPVRIRVERPEGGAGEIEARFGRAGDAPLAAEYEARLPLTGGGVTFGLVPRSPGPHRMLLTVYDEAGAELGRAGFGICIGEAECPSLRLAAPDAPGPLFP